MVIKAVEIGGEGKLPINEFKLDSMCANPSIVMIAKRGSGKSVVTKAILKHFRDIPVGIIIAPTDRMNCFYGNFFPDSYIHYAYRSDIIQKLLYRQEQIIEKRQKRERKGKKLDSRGFIVMDDCLASKGTWMKDQPIQELLFNGRHYELMYILTMQFPLGISPNLRSNFDIIILLAEDYISNLKRIFDHYAGMFPDFNSFRSTFTQLTQDYGCMVINNRGARSSFLEKIFWYKAPFDTENLNMGCKQFRKFHEDNYDPKWRMKSKGLDINEFCSRKKSEKGELKIEKVQADDQPTTQKRKAKTSH